MTAILVLFTLNCTPAISGSSYYTCSDSATEMLDYRPVFGDVADIEIVHLDDEGKFTRQVQGCKTMFTDRGGLKRRVYLFGACKDALR